MIDCQQSGGDVKGRPEIRYSGWVVVEAEQDPVKAPPFAYTKLGHDHLTWLFTTAGMTIER